MTVFVHSVFDYGIVLSLGRQGIQCKVGVVAS